MKVLLSSMPGATRERMPAYFLVLRRFLLEGKLRVRSSEIAAITHQNPVQVRSDLGYIDNVGMTGYGYLVRQLYTRLAALLGTGEGYTAVSVGEGYGRGETGLAESVWGRCGIRMVGQFDEALSDEELAGVLADLAPDIGVIAPECHAPERAMAVFCAAGVKGILNFTDTVLYDERIRVKNCPLSDPILLLCGEMREEGVRRGGEVEGTGENGENDKPTLRAAEEIP